MLAILPELDANEVAVGFLLPNPDGPVGGALVEGSSDGASATKLFALPPAIILPLPFESSWLSIPSTIPFLTPFFVISFFRSALAPSDTLGAVNISTTDWRATSLTPPSLSSRVSTKWCRNGRRGKWVLRSRS